MQYRGIAIILGIYICILFETAIVSSQLITSDCVIKLKNKTYDLTPLRKWNPWNITLTKNGSLISYELSICDGLVSKAVDDPCAGVAVCKIFKGERLPLAENTKELGVKSINVQIEKLFIILTGPSCTNQSGSVNHTVLLILTCGPHLGFPELFTDDSCQTSFTWATSLVCPNLVKYNEVPCSTYDIAGRLYDLSPLIQKKSNHRIETHDGSEFMVINVCSNLVADNISSNCPNNVSSCIKKNGNYLPGGSLVGPLKLKTHDNGLELIYVSNFTIGGCTGPAKTVVDFQCPSDGKEKRPELVLSSDCLYNIYWETEFACPVSILLGNATTCTFQRDIHGVDIDLSPLRKLSGEVPYNVSGIVNGTTVNFFFNICGGLGRVFQCNSQFTSNTVCVKFNSSDTGTVYGNSQKILRYTSGEVTLEYAGNVKCGSNGDTWKHVIRFTCDSNTDNNGKGYPKFAGQESCVNWFEWKTSYACVKNRNFDCLLQNGPLSIVLNPMFRHHSEATWKAIDSLSPIGKSREIFLNLCDGLDLMGAPQPCSSKTSLCMIENNTAISLGEKSINPDIKYEYLNGTHTYKVEFANGDACPGGFKTSTLRLKCEKTYYTSSPVLVSESACHYEFEWQTYAACQYERLIFHDCKFEDRENGVVVDLNPLKSSTYYEIKTNDYTYYLNICGPVKNTPCNEKGMVQARGCQVENTLNSPKGAWSLGENPLGVAYDNGELINITFTGGSPYRDSKRTPRSMSIVFICDLDAGYGKPVYNGEENRVYSFLWKTNLACGIEDVAKECVVYDKDHHKQYDFSRLTRLTGHEDWTVLVPDYSDSKTGKKKKLYLNVCRPVNKANLCHKQSSACVTEIVNGKEVSNIPNLGKPTNSPRLTGEDRLELHYTSGDICYSYGRQTNYSVMINFLCNSKSLESQGPTFLTILGNCTYSLLWTTEAACAIGKQEYHSCSFTDSVTGVNFDLNPLHKEDSFYEVFGDNRHFQVNICGPVGGTACPSSKIQDDISVCEMNADGKMRHVLGITETGVVTAFEGHPTQVTYLGLKNGTVNPYVNFEFKCDQSALNPVITFEREEPESHFSFSVATRLVCQPKSVKCNVISENGIEYNLASLARNASTFWTVKPSGSNTVYHLSFCSTISGVGGVTCHGAGACVTDSLNLNNVQSLGNQVKSPEITVDGTLVVTYEGGSPCLKDKTMNNSAIVTLYCSGKESALRLISQSEDCVFYFSLDSPAACPVTIFKGSNCQVQDRIYNNLYDLRSLINKTDNYVSKGGGHTYLLNVCDAISNPLPGCEGSAICQTKDNHENISVDAGKPSGQLFFKNGLIQLFYEGGKSNCHKQYNRSTIINFLCDHSTDGSSGPVFVTEDHDCTYVFEWYTSWACPPFLEKSCTAVDHNGHEYDLSELSLPNNNYYLENPENENEKFVINICRSIVHRPESRCPYEASSCRIDTDTRNLHGRSLNLGKLVNGPVIESGILKIRYVNGDVCRNEGTFKRFMETVIEFRCDELAYGSQPEFLTFQDCLYTFIWFTPSACRKEVLTEHTGSCLIENPRTGYVFDFSSLRGKEVSVQSSPHHKFSLAVCSDVKDSPCEKGSGSCQMEHAGEQQSVNGGMSNSNIEMHEGAIFLKYSNGSFCHNGRDRRNTIINFICDKDRITGESKVSYVTESSDCTYYFHWHTKLACDPSESDENIPITKEADCKVQTKQGLVDLSGEKNKNIIGISNFEMNGIYVMSVCGKIGNNFIRFPDAAAAACVNCSPNDTMSLGKFYDGPYLNSDEVIELNYYNGSVCLKDPSKKMSSSIYFVCESKRKESELSVVGSSNDGCTVYFEYSTPSACPIKSKTCGYGHEQKGFNLNLIGFENATKPFEVSEPNDKDKFFISICKPLNISNCTGAGVCLINNSGNQNFGLINNSFVYHNSLHMTLTYDSDVNCSDSVTGKRHTEIRFYCDPSAGLGKPQLYKKLPCHIIFLWASAEVCSSKQPVCTLWTKDQKLYDLRVLSSISHSWKVSDEKGNVHWLNLCREVKIAPEDSANFTCPSYASSCFVAANTTTGVSLGNVFTQKIRIDEKTKDIILTYNHGDAGMCTQSSTNATALLDESDLRKPSTEITLRCGIHTGYPKLVASPSESDCSYKFFWETHIACPELEQEPVFEHSGLIYDPRLHSIGIVINITSLMTKTYVVPNLRHNDDFVYYINLGDGVKDNISDPTCENALVCQSKADHSFFRDIGSVGTKNFYLRGSELKLILTSHGRKCGKNNSKNVTTIINFQCSRTFGLGTPKFQYESGDCDYLFDWETTAVCTIHTKPVIGTMDVLNSLQPPNNAAKTLSITAIIAIICAILLSLVIFAVFIKKERRNAIKVKARKCFHSVRLPRYRNVQCYFLRLRGDPSSNLSRSEGEAVLLSPGLSDHPFQDDSDVDPLT